MISSNCWEKIPRIKQELSFAQIKELADKGVKFDEITLGNMSIVGDRKQIYKSTGFTEEEAQTLFDLERDGVKIYFQTQPTDKKESLDMIKKTFPNVQ